MVISIGSGCLRIGRSVWRARNNDPDLVVSQRIARVETARVFSSGVGTDPRAVR